jgi:NAD(P)-dependent dehydrogenase (short-subunit alcohol dehydrogenase family)
VDLLPKLPRVPNEEELLRLLESTNSTPAVAALLTNEAARARIMSRTPMGRLGEPEEVARIAVFLASDDASYLTGTTVYPDGGRLGLNYVM